MKYAPLVRTRYNRRTMQTHSSIVVFLLLLPIFSSATSSDSLYFCLCLSQLDLNSFRRFKVKISFIYLALGLINILERKKVIIAIFSKSVLCFIAMYDNEIEFNENSITMAKEGKIIKTHRKLS